MGGVDNMVIKNNLDKELERVKVILDQTPMEEFEKQLEECGACKATEDFYCTDCNGYREQSFIKEMPDNTLLYLCKTCGCENSLENDKCDKYNGNYKYQWRFDNSSDSEWYPCHLYEDYTFDIDPGKVAIFTRNGTIMCVNKENFRKIPEGEYLKQAREDKER